MSLTKTTCRWYSKIGLNTIQTFKLIRLKAKTKPLSLLKSTIKSFLKVFGRRFLQNTSNQLKDRDRNSTPLWSGQKYSRSSKAPWRHTPRTSNAWVPPCTLKRAKDSSSTRKKRWTSTIFSKSIKSTRFTTSAMTWWMWSTTSSNNSRLAGIVMNVSTTCS